MGATLCASPATPGLPTVHEVQLSELADNIGSGASRQSPFARFILKTNADSITVTGETDLHSAFAAYAHLGVRVNGTARDPLVFAADGIQDFTVPLGAPGVRKEVEIITGLQSSAGGAFPRGSFIKSVSYPPTASFDVERISNVNTVLFYGDSISVGGNSKNPEYEAYVPLLRSNYGINALLEGWGYRALYDDASTPGKLNAFVAHLATSKSSTIWLAIGTNDYGLNRWDAASFGSAYAAVLDGLHTALPQARIFCQTPLPRKSEAPNSKGNTLADYRAQIETVCNTRNWATLVDGTKLLSVTDLADGVHPTTDGFSKYADEIAKRLKEKQH